MIGGIYAPRTQAPALRAIGSPRTGLIDRPLSFRAVRIQTTQSDRGRGIEWRVQGGDEGAETVEVNEHEVFSAWVACGGFRRPL